MRPRLLLRTALLLVALALIALLLRLALWTGLGPLGVIAAVVILAVLLQGVPYILRQFVKGYRRAGGSRK